MFASSLLLPLIYSDRREAASYLGSHDEEQDTTSEWSISVSCMQPLTVTWSCGVNGKMLRLIIGPVPVIYDLGTGENELA